MIIIIKYTIHNHYYNNQSLPETLKYLRQQIIGASIIYLSRILCLSSCRPVILSSWHPVTIAERSAILLVLVSKLTKETKGRDSRGRDTDGEIGGGEIEEGGCEETFLCLSLT